MAQRKEQAVAMIIKGRPKGKPKDDGRWPRLGQRRAQGGFPYATGANQADTLSPLQRSQ